MGAFRFLVARVRDFGPPRAVLEQRQNPFAVVGMAHLTARDVQEGTARKQAKLRLIRGLYTTGYSREEMLAPFRFIDWLLVLPPALEQELWEEFRHFEEVQRMPYIPMWNALEYRRDLNKGSNRGSVMLRRWCWRP